MTEAGAIGVVTPQERQGCRGIDEERSNPVPYLTP